MTRPDHDDESDLRAAFQALRREDTAQAPPFEAVVAGAGRRSLFPGWAMLAAASLAAAAIAGALRWRLVPPPAATSIGHWTAPTDFLLNTPGRELLETVPPIGGSALFTPPDGVTVVPSGQRSTTP